MHCGTLEAQDQLNVLNCLQQMDALSIQLCPDDEAVRSQGRTMYLINCLLVSYKFFKKLCISVGSYDKEGLNER